jgi:hypothetical protein
MSHSILVASVVLSSSAALVHGFRLHASPGRTITNYIAMQAANQNAPVEIRDVKVRKGHASSVWSFIFLLFLVENISSILGLTRWHEDA